MQQVDLVRHCMGGGLTVKEALALLDGAPALEFSVWVGARTDQGAMIDVCTHPAPGPAPVPTPAMAPIFTLSRTPSCSVALCFGVCTW